jgi:phytoene/squalene synthetase
MALAGEPGSHHRRLQEWRPGMTPSLAAKITKAASKQTYYTIRFLVDRSRVADAYRAYAYFRWLDDVLDAESSSPGGPDERAERLAFLDRQEALLDACIRGDAPRNVDPHEAMLVELVRHSDPADADLRSYVSHMMRVMAFDARRRGRLISRVELDEYTRSLAVAVSDAMHHFIGHGSDDALGAEDRYRAVTGAHIVHMLRDTEADLRAGYFNVPREVLQASSIGPHDVHCDAYRAWVRERVRQAGAELAAGEAYFARLRSRRHRLAGLAYIARFRWLIDRFERDGFQVRPSYADVARLPTTLRMASIVVSGMVGRPHIHRRPDAWIPGIGGRP